MNLGIIYLATGPYIEFFTDFYDTAEKYFIPEAQKFYYIFTDRSHPYFEKPNVIHIPQHQEYWPDVVLHKYHLVLEIQQMFEKIDFLLVMNANLKFVDEINAKEFLPSVEDNYLVGVEHPTQNQQPISKRPFENRQESTAYIKPEKRGIYFQSAIFGGRKQEFLRMCFTLRNNVEIDYSKNIIAIWHDESHLNSYFYNYKFPKVLSPAYLYPENIKLHGVKPKILMLDKSKKGGKTFSYYRKYSEQTPKFKNKFQYYKHILIYNLIKVLKKLDEA